jgi:hypothetical protein
MFFLFNIFQKGGGSTILAPKSKKVYRKQKYSQFHRDIIKSGQEWESLS